MTFEEHCIESIKLFGKPYEEIHKWLDEFAGSKKYGMKHRFLRHNLKGINEIKNKFGIQAAIAAKQHIVSDLKMEGWNETIHKIPKDEKDYLKMGLF